MNAWQSSWKDPDARPIYQWAHEEGELPAVYAVPGRFDIESAPFCREVFDALQNPTVREVVDMSSVQSLKTLIAELYLLWSIVENPGPTQWLQNTDEEADEHAKERFLKLIAAFPCVHRYFTQYRHDRTTRFINFAHMYLRMEGQANIKNLQRKSIKTQVRSEVWQWKSGHLKEADARMTQFTFNSKSFTESQPGVADDQMDALYSSGNQKVWQFACLGCGKFQPYLWSYIRQDGTRAAMRWEDSSRTRRDDGEWRWNELVPTIRYECIYCGHGHTDDPRTRRLMLASGKYIAQNPNAPPTIESFNRNQLCIPNLPWFETKIGGVKNFLVANDWHKKGVDGYLREFFQKVMAEKYDPNKHAGWKQPLVYISGDWPDEKFRFMTVDVQETFFPAVIRAWSIKGASRLLWAGNLASWQEVSDKQKEFKVFDASVFVDSSYDTREVYKRCALHGHWGELNRRARWFCWYPMNGEQHERRSFAWKNPRTEKTILLPYQFPFKPVDGYIGTDEQGRQRNPELIFWANGTIKEILCRLRDGKGAEWLAYDGVCEEWKTAMFSERRVSVVDKYGQVKFVWQRIGKRLNNLWDCEAMQVVAAAIGGALGEPIELEEKEKKAA